MEKAQDELVSGDHCQIFLKVNGVTLSPQISRQLRYQRGWWERSRRWCRTKCHNIPRLGRWSEISHYKVFFLQTGFL